MYFQPINTLTRKNDKIQKMLLEGFQNAFKKQWTKFQKISCTKKYFWFKSKDVNYYFFTTWMPTSKTVYVFNQNLVSYNFSVFIESNKIVKFSVVLPSYFEGNVIVEDDFTNVFFKPNTIWDFGTVFSFEESNIILKLLTNKARIYWTIHFTSWLCYIENFWFALPWKDKKIFKGKLLLEQSETFSTIDVENVGLCSYLFSNSKELWDEFLVLLQENDTFLIQSIAEWNDNFLILGKTYKDHKILKHISRWNMIIEDYTWAMKLTQDDKIYDLPKISKINDIIIDKSFGSTFYTFDDSIYVPYWKGKTLIKIEHFFSPSGLQLNLNVEQKTHLLRRMSKLKNCNFCFLRLGFMKNLYDDFFEKEMQVLHANPSFEKLLSLFHLYQITTLKTAQQNWFMFQIIPNWVKLLDGLWLKIDYTENYFLRFIQKQWEIFILELVKLEENWEIIIIEKIAEVNITKFSKPYNEFLCLECLNIKSRHFDLFAFKSCFLFGDKILLNIKNNKMQIIRGRTANIIHHLREFRAAIERSWILYESSNQYMLKPNKDTNKILQEINPNKIISDVVKCRTFLREDMIFFNEQAYETPIFYFGKNDGKFSSLSKERFSKIENCFSIYSAWKTILPYAISAVYWGDNYISFNNKHVDKKFNKGTNIVLIVREVLHNAHRKALIKFPNLIK